MPHALYDAVSYDRARATAVLLVAYPEGCTMREPSDKSTMMHYASRYGNLTPLQVLVSCHARGVEALDGNQWSPLHVAAECKKPKVVAYLAALSPQLVAQQDPFGWTPMHAAARNGDADVMRLLVQSHPAAARTLNRTGDTPLQTAKRCGSHSCVEVLEPTS